MKAISPALKALLATRRFIGIDLYIITLIDGTVLRWSGGDADILDNGFRYPCGGWTGPYWGLMGDNAQCHWKLGTDVQTLTVSVLPGAALIEGIPFTQAVAIGLFDGAVLEYRRALSRLQITIEYFMESIGYNRSTVVDPMECSITIILIKRTMALLIN